ncbi:DUF1259 domain-containing protein [Streptomyces sp. NPDC091212]|uniref:DUF1259 domain-containing protein n=1 Tax=Streptomyces sp. NPDC091212 TaxID=3155191 RepID=UPI0034185679
MKRESQKNAPHSSPQTSQTSQTGQTGQTGQGSPVNPAEPADRTDRRTSRRTVTPRRRLLAAAALAPLLAPVLTGVGVGSARARSAVTPGTETGGTGAGGGEPAGPVQPVPTTEADWKGVAKALGRPGSLVRGLFYHTRFPRGDLHVVTRGVTVAPGLALGSHMAFVRYADGTTSVMGDLNVTEGELQRVTDSLFQHGIEVTALHKHLLAHTPDVWWLHIHGHAHGTDPVPLARGLRAAIGRTASPPATEPGPPRPLDLDLAGMEAALGVAGSNDGGIHKAVFARRETVVHEGKALPRGLAATSAFNFQPLGGGRAAVNGDFAMVADEVQKVLSTLRRGGLELVELHNHGLTEEPRLFFAHFWGVDDAVRLARALRPAVDATNVVPVSMTDGSVRVSP